MPSDEETKRYGIISLVAFNVAVILLIIIYAIARGGMSQLHFMDFIVVLFLASLAAGGAFGICMKLKI